jgi:zinc protease
MRQIFLIIFFLFSTFAKAGNVQEFQLKNGLKIIVKEDHRTNVVVSQIWYKVGGSYEPDGITGISHALEHMMFRGTTHYPDSQFSHVVAAKGGRENAQTSQDYTFYYEELAANELPLAFALEADRMRNLLIRKTDFDKEKQIILEERRMRVEDDPFSRAYEQFSAAAFLNTYRNPVIGWVQDIEGLSAEKLRKWYEHWYSPNNATLVVVGDVDPKAVYNLAEKYFGGFSSSKIEPVSFPLKKDPGRQEFTIQIPAKLPWLLVGYRTPSLVTATPKWHAYALEVLSGILSSGNSSRLNKQLVREKRLATEADANYDLYDKLDGLFLITAIPKTKAATEDLKKSVLDQIEQLQTHPVTEEELTRVKNQIMARQVYKKDSLFGEGRELGLLETIGLSYKLADEYSTNIQAITPEQIQTVAKRYLRPEQLTIAVLMPLSQ